MMIKKGDCKWPLGPHVEGWVGGLEEGGGVLWFSFPEINARCLTDFLAGRKRVTWLLSACISPASPQPRRFGPRRNKAQVLHKIHAPSLPAWTCSPSSPHLPRKQEELPRPLCLDACLEHLIPASSTHIFQVGPRGRLRAELFATAKVPACEEGDFFTPCGRLFALSVLDPRTHISGQELRKTPCGPVDPGAKSQLDYGFICVGSPGPTHFPSLNLPSLQNGHKPC